MTFNGSKHYEHRSDCSQGAVRSGSILFVLVDNPQLVVTGRKRVNVKIPNISNIIRFKAIHHNDHFKPLKC